ncbi:hypothetical protein E2P64_08150 [Candidatus Bathyarchaeota archaeon]|nr:hypothetical protein E2P64_08150 [Candidatus Bathyarchaeota archaeon]
MTTYITRQMQLLVTENQNGTGQVINRGERQTKFEEIDELAEAEFKKYVLALPVTDKDLLEGTTISLAKILYLETDTELTVKLETTGDTGFKVKPLVSDEASEKRGVLYLEGEFTKVYVTPVGTEGEANIILGVVGA